MIERPPGPDRSFARMLVVTDEPRWALPLLALLGSEDWSLAACSLEDAARACAGIDVVLVDVSTAAGAAACAAVRRQTEAPILAVGPATREDSVVSTLACGADSYAAVTDSARVLFARARSLLRRIGSVPPRDEGGTAAFAGIEIDLDQRMVTIDGRAVAFPSPDLEILDVLVRRQGGVARRSELRQAPSLADVGDRNLDFHIRRLRDQLQCVAGGSHRIANVHGIGFRLISGGRED